MRSITNIIISFFDLLEAEGRSFRKSAVAAAESISVIFFALFLMFVGAVVAFFSLYLLLSLHIGRIGGSAVIAVLLLALGGYLLSAAHSRGLKGEPLFGRGEGEKTPLPSGEDSDER